MAPMRLQRTAGSADQSGWHGLNRLVDPDMVVRMVVMMDLPDFHPA